MHDMRNTMTPEEKASARRAYKEAPKPGGVFCVRNLRTGKVYFGSSMNVHGPLNRIRFELNTNRHPTPALQEDWNRLGPEAFAFEILELVKPSDKPGFDPAEELTLLEQIWMEKLQPFEKGYNINPKIRY
jgi:hypothetical protein